MADDDPGDHNNATGVAEDDPAVPDYLASPDAVLHDDGAEWRFGKPPDYSRTRKNWAETKTMDHPPGSLPQLVENLVKNWEIEASFKPRLSDWRTIDHSNYSFAMNGGCPRPAEHMLKVGTYNAILCPSEYYSPEFSDFAASHKTFKGMMPTFAWEVVEVYSGPPTVAFKWRHWGVMRNDYVGFNDKGEKVTAKAHGGPIEIFGVTVANVGDGVRLQSIDTWMDPIAIFRQIAPNGVVNKVPVDHRVEKPHVGETADENRVAGTDAESNDVVVAEDAQRDVPDSIMIDTIRDNENVPASTGDESSAPQASRGIGSSNHQTLDEAASNTSPGLPTGTDEQSSESTQQQEQDFPGLDVEAESTSTEKLEHQHTATTIEPTISSAKRPKLNNDPAESQDQTSGMVLQTEGPSRDQHPQVSHSIHVCPVTGSSGDKTHTTTNQGDQPDSTVLATMDNSNANPHKSSNKEHEHRRDIEETIMPDAGEAIVAPADSEETLQTHQEMSNITPDEMQDLMNQE